MPPAARLLIQAISRVALALIVGLPIAGCGPAALLNARVPDDGYRVERDLAYGEAARQRLDLYLPTAVVALASIVVFFHGGRWRRPQDRLPLRRPDPRRAGLRCGHPRLPALSRGAVSRPSSRTARRRSPGCNGTSAASAASLGRST